MTPDDNRIWETTTPPPRHLPWNEGPALGVTGQGSAVEGPAWTIPQREFSLPGREVVRVSKATSKVHTSEWLWDQGRRPQATVRSPAPRLGWKTASSPPTHHPVLALWGVRRRWLELVDHFILRWVRFILLHLREELQGLLFFFGGVVAQQVGSCGQDGGPACPCHQVKADSKCNVDLRAVVLFVLLLLREDQL